MKQRKLIINFFVNRNWKKLADSRQGAKILADNRKCHHPIETICCKKYSMSWAQSKEAGPEAGQGRGKLVSYDWLTKSSPGLPLSIAQD